MGLKKKELINATTLHWLRSQGFHVDDVYRIRQVTPCGEIIIRYHGALRLVQLTRRESRELSERLQTVLSRKNV